MGSKRIGLARVEALLEALKRDINFTSTTLTDCIITTSAAATFTGAHSISGTGAHTVYGQDMYNNGIQTTMWGLHPQWSANWGAAIMQGLDPASGTDDVLSSGVTALNLSKALEYVAGLTAVPTAVHAATVFGGSGVLGVDVPIGTSGAPGATPTVTQRISRLTGGISGTVVMTVGADMTTAGDETLILFTGNTLAGTGILKLTTHANNSLDAESSEVWVTTEGTDLLVRQAAFVDGRNLILLTDTGLSTILAGSFLYLHAGHDSNILCVKGVIRTTGGTVVVTDA